MLFFRIQGQISLSLSLLMVLFVWNLQKTIDLNSDNHQQEMSFLDHCMCNWVDRNETMNRSNRKTVELNCDVALQFARNDICLRSTMKDE
jgi:hypothetical protein